MIQKGNYLPVWHFWCKGQGQQHSGSTNCTFLPLQDLKEWVAVESDSVQPHLRKEVMRMMALAADRLAALGATVNLVNMGSQQVLIWFLDLKHHIYTWVYLLHSVLYTRMLWYSAIFWKLDTNLSIVLYLHDTCWNQVWESILGTTQAIQTQIDVLCMRGSLMLLTGGKQFAKVKGLSFLLGLVFEFLSAMKLEN